MKVLLQPDIILTKCRKGKIPRPGWWWGSKPYYSWAALARERTCTKALCILLFSSSCWAGRNKLAGYKGQWKTVSLGKATNFCLFVCLFLVFLFFIFLLGIFLIYISNAIPKVLHTPPPLPTHSHFLALAFPCTGAKYFLNQIIWSMKDYSKCGCHLVNAAQIKCHTRRNLWFLSTCLHLRDFNINLKSPGLLKCQSRSTETSSTFYYYWKYIFFRQYILNRGPAPSSTLICICTHSVSH
jgi:hypothetical protein